MNLSTLSARLVTTLLLVAASGSSAFAQTADGVGAEPNAAERALSAEEIREQAEAVAALQDYEPKFYQLSLRTWMIYTPPAFLDGQFSLHTNMWEDGVVNLSYGAEFTTRIPEKYDLVVSVDWANLRTADGWWVEDGDDIGDATWTESNLSLLNADVAFHWLTNLNRAQTFQMYYGLGLGLAFVLGEFAKYNVDTDGCTNPETGERWSTDDRNTRQNGLLRGCFDENGNPSRVSDRELQNIPPVLPAVSATLGFRGLIADRVSIALEGGFKTLYFYGGLEVGYFWGTRP
jgi:hypothetical protein